MKLSIKEVTEHFNKKYYKMQKYAKALACSWNAGENLFADGPGGYSKSACTWDFGMFLYEKGFIKTKPFVISFNQGTTEEKIYGGVDLKTYKNTGELIYLLEKSMLVHEFVIIEEIGDALPHILASLKDTLTSGYVRNGSQLEKISTKMIVGCTNRSREDLICDLSTEAFLQRFPTGMKVYWDTHYETDYHNMFKLRNYDTESCDVIAKIISIVNNKKELSLPVSPRTAIKAIDYYINNDKDISTLEFFNGFEKAVHEYSIIMAEHLKDKARIVELKNHFVGFTEKVDNIIETSKVEGNFKKVQELMMELAVYNSKAPKSRDSITEVHKVINEFCSKINNKLLSKPGLISSLPLIGKHLEVIFINDLDELQLIGAIRELSTKY